MFARLPRKKRDTRRAELIGILKEARNVPRPMLAMAYLAVSSMTSDELDAALSISRRVAPLIEDGDVDGIRAVLSEYPLPDELRNMAEGMLSAEPDPDADLLSAAKDYLLGRKHAGPAD